MLTTIAESHTMAVSAGNPTMPITGSSTPLMWGSSPNSCIRRMIIDTGIISLKRIQHADAVRFRQYLKNARMAFSFTWCCVYTCEKSPSVRIFSTSGFVSFIFSSTSDWVITFLLFTSISELSTVKVNSKFLLSMILRM